VTTEEVQAERPDVGAALSQGRHLDREHGEAIEEILAESAFVDIPPEVAIGGRDDSNICLEGRGRAQPLEPTILQDVQQLRLQLQRNLADLIQEELSIRLLGRAAQLTLMSG
jgi:hypothetical protein